jgi:hypothetical protein
MPSFDLVFVPFFFFSSPFFYLLQLTGEESFPVCLTIVFSLKAMLQSVLNIPPHRVNVSRYNDNNCLIG